MSIQEVALSTRHYPRFSDGRIDYTNERICYGVNCVVIYQDRVLLTKRSQSVIAYPGLYSGVSGFVDKPDVSIEEHVKMELHEEVRAPMHAISKLKLHPLVTHVDEKLNREWRIWVSLVEVTEQFMPESNWENDAVEWFDIEQAAQLDLVPGFQHTLKLALSLRDN